MALHRRSTPSSPSPLMESLEDRRLLASASLNFSGGEGGVSGSGLTTRLSGTDVIASLVNVVSGKLRVRTTSGDVFGTRNNQANALGLPVDAAGNFTITTRLTSLQFSRNWQNGGIYVGLNENTYVKLVAAYQNGPGIQLGSEVGARFTSAAFKSQPFKRVKTLDLRLIGNAANKTLVAQYRINSNKAAFTTIGQVGNSSVFYPFARTGVVS